MLCLNKSGNDYCFQSKNFPIVPMSLDESYFLAHLKWNGIFYFHNYNGDYFFDLVVPFVYYILESPEFYPKKVVPTTPTTPAPTKPQPTASTTSKAKEVPKPTPVKMVQSR